MEIWQIILLSYGGALVAWLIINAIFLIVSLSVKHKVFSTLEALTAIMVWLFGAATFIGDIWLIIWLFTHGNIIFAVCAFFVGFGVVSFAGQLLTLPFVFITSLFSGWYTAIDESEK